MQTPPASSTLAASSPSTPTTSSEPLLPSSPEVEELRLSWTRMDTLMNQANSLMTQGGNILEETVKSLIVEGSTRTEDLTGGIKLLIHIEKQVLRDDPAAAEHPIFKAFFYYRLKLEEERNQLPVELNSRLDAYKQSVTQMVDQPLRQLKTLSKHVMDKETSFTSQFKSFTFDYGNDKCVSIMPEMMPLRNADIKTLAYKEAPKSVATSSEVELFIEVAKKKFIINRDSSLPNYLIRAKKLGIEEPVIYVSFVRTEPIKRKVATLDEEEDGGEEDGDEEINFEENSEGTESSQTPLVSHKSSHSAEVLPPSSGASSPSGASTSASPSGAFSGSLSLSTSTPQSASSIGQGSKKQKTSNNRAWVRTDLQQIYDHIAINGELSVEDKRSFAAQFGVTVKQLNNKLSKKGVKLLMEEALRIKRDRDAISSRNAERNADNIASKWSETAQRVIALSNYTLQFGNNLVDRVVTPKKQE